MKKKRPNSICNVYHCQSYQQQQAWSEIKNPTYCSCSQTASVIDTCLEPIKNQAPKYFRLPYQIFNDINLMLPVGSGKQSRIFVKPYLAQDIICLIIDFSLSYGFGVILYCLQNINTAIQGKKNIDLNIAICKIYIQKRKNALITTQHLILTF